MSSLKERLKASASQFKAVIPFKNPHEENGTLFGETVYLRMMMASEADAYQSSQRSMAVDYQGKKFQARATLNLENLRARFAVLVLADEDGNRLFTDKETAEVGTWPWHVLDAIYEQGLAHNKMDKEAEAVMEKNSNQTVNLTSGSPSPDI